MTDLALLIGRFIFLAMMYAFIFWALRVILKEKSAVSTAAGKALRMTIASDSLGPKVLTLENKTKIGRAMDNDIVIDDPGASAHHATIVRRDNSWTITDLDSKNGTFVDGRRLLEPAELSGTEQIMIGKTKMDIGSD